MKTYIVLACAFIYSLNIASAFDFQSELEKAQNRFKNAYTDYPIIIMNQDRLDFLFLTNKAYGDENKKLRLEIIKEYVKEEIGINISDRQADAIEPYTTVLKESAFALPIKKDGNNKDYHFCAVLPASPNSNHRLEIERLTGLLTEGVYEGKTYEYIRSLLDFEKLSLFSLYHEIAHCLDYTYLPQAFVYNDDPHIIHMSESFAESFALMLLHQMGYKNLAKDREAIRTLYAKKMGAWFHRNPGLGFGSQNFTHGGTIYYLGPVLRESENFIQKARNDFANYDVHELNKFIQKIVKDNALPARSFTAISLSLKDETPDTIVNLYRERAYTHTDLFFEAYEDLILYHDYTDYVLERNILSTPRELKSGEELVEIDLSLICQLVADNKYQQYSDYLTSVRKNLQNSDEYLAEQMRHQVKVLNSLKCE